jgi:hypothetical protein
VKLWIVGFAALALAPRAYADSCDERVEGVMAHYPTYVTYCAECGDAAPSAPVATVPGQAIDASHAYVQTSRVRFDLVGALAGCPLADGPLSLRVIDETPTGMLIVPDAVAVVAPPAAAAAAPKPAAPIVVTVDDTPAGWLVGVIGGLAGSLLTLAWCVPRRRRRMQLPRAIDLPRVRIDECER